VVDSLGRPVVENAPAGSFFIIGNPYPDWFSGIRNTVSYGNWSLSFLWDIRVGGKVFNLTKLNMLAMGTHKETENRDNNSVFPNSVKADGTANTTPIKLDRDYYSYLGGDFGNVPERGIEDATWYRLRDVTLKYNFPVDWIKKAFFKTLSLSLSGRNLLLFTPYSGVDPETNAGGNDPSFGRDAYNMPNTRSYHFTINATF